MSVCVSGTVKTPILTKGKISTLSQLEDVKVLKTFQVVADKLGKKAYKVGNDTYRIDTHSQFYIQLSKKNGNWEISYKGDEDYMPQLNKIGDLFSDYYQALVYEERLTEEDFNTSTKILPNWEVELEGVEQEW